MKVTLPNGAIIEADEVEVKPDGSFVLRDLKTNEDRRPEAANNLSDVQYRTYKALKKAVGKASVTWIADELEITSSAASQRMRTLIEAGVVERTSHAHYKVVD